MNPTPQPEVPVAGNVVIKLLADGRVLVSGDIPTNELLVRGLFEKAKELVIGHMQKKAAQAPAIQVAPAGFLNGIGG